MCKLRFIESTAPLLSSVLFWSNVADLPVLQVPSAPTWIIELPMTNAKSAEELAMVQLMLPMRYGKNQSKVKEQDSPHSEHLTCLGDH